MKKIFFVINKWTNILTNLLTLELDKKKKYLEVEETKKTDCVVENHSHQMQMNFFCNLTTNGT